MALTPDTGLPGTAGDVEAHAPVEPLACGRDAAEVWDHAEAGTLDEAGVGELLRREGLHAADLQHFREEALAGLEAKPVRAGESPEAKRVKELERELKRKEKALAEAAALLVLRKKLNALWEEAEGEDTDETKE